MILGTRTDTGLIFLYFMLCRIIRFLLILLHFMSYYIRFEMYAGKRRGDGESSAFDHKTGAAAVIRNLKIVLEPSTSHRWHAVVIDRYYSSIPLAIELLHFNVYSIGTIMTNRIGYDKNIKMKQKTRPSGIPRGSFTFSRSVAAPSMIAFHWWDRKPVHYLCTGSALTDRPLDER